MFYQKPLVEPMIEFGKCDHNRGPPLTTSVIMHIFVQNIFCPCFTTYRMVYFSAVMHTSNLWFIFVSPASWHYLDVTCKLAGKMLLVSHQSARKKLTFLLPAGTLPASWQKWSWCLTSQLEKITLFCQLVDCQPISCFCYVSTKLIKLI